MGDMLDIPQQNPLKYGFNGIELSSIPQRNYALILPVTYKVFNRLLLMYINTLWLDAYVNC